MPVDRFTTGMDERHCDDYRRKAARLMMDMYNHPISFQPHQCRIDIISNIACITFTHSSLFRFRHRSIRLILNFRYGTSYRRHSLRRLVHDPDTIIATHIYMVVMSMCGRCATYPPWLQRLPNRLACVRINHSEPVSDQHSLPHILLSTYPLCSIARKPYIVRFLACLCIAKYSFYLLRF